MDKLSTYNSVRSLISFGDQIVFSGKGRTSNLIKRFTNSVYSHVGVAVWVTPLLTAEPRLFILESATLNTTPDINNEYRRAIQLVTLSQRLEGYDGCAWWLPLKQPLSLEEKEHMLEWSLKTNSSRADYDTTQAILAGIDVDKWPKPLNWLFSPIGRLFTTKKDLKRLFCSELATAFWQECNRVPPHIIASEQVPEDTIKFDAFIQPPVRIL